MLTFRTPEKPHFALIRCPELAEPPECKVVPAFRTFDLDGWKCLDLLQLVIHYHDLFFNPFSLHFHLVCDLDLPDITTFPALQLTGRRHEQSLAFGTEHLSYYA